MLELAMASLLAHKPPSIALKKLQKLANFHAVSMPQSAACRLRFAVGMRITVHPPHRSEQARFAHSAPTSGI